MIDLEKLDNEIDKIFEQETSDSLTKWLLNKRHGNINNLLGSGTFIGMEQKKDTFFSCTQNARFVETKLNYPINPINRIAA